MRGEDIREHQTINVWEDIFMAYFKALYAVPHTDIRNILANYDQDTIWSPRDFRVVPRESKAKAIALRDRVVQRDGLWYFSY